jgi:hypothetical protein
MFRRCPDTGGRDLVGSVIHSCSTIVSVAFLFAILSIAAGCGTSPDSVTSGSICAPGTSDCPVQQTITRSQTGNNLLDVEITNRGPEAIISLDVAPRTEDAARARDVGATATREGLFPVSYQLGTGESTTDRFGPAELPAREQLQLELGCRTCSGCDSPCRVEAEYVYLTEMLECDNDDDCGRGQICRPATGTCVECLNNGECEGNQTCHEESGRCLPPTSGGCGHAPTGPAAPPWLVLVVLTGLVRWYRQCTTSPASTTGLSAFAGLALTSTILVAPADADARNPDSTLSLGAGPRFVTGDLGRDVERGIGAELHEAIRWRHVGVDFWIETNYFLTTQRPPPLAHELQIFGFGLGPRGYVPVGPIELTLGIGYQRLGFGPNALVRQTGPSANFHAIGGEIGVGYQFSSFVIRTDAQFQPLLGTNGSLLSFNLAFGMTTR